MTRLRWPVIELALYRVETSVYGPLVKEPLWDHVYFAMYAPVRDQVEVLVAEYASVKAGMDFRRASYLEIAQN